MESETLPEETKETALQSPWVRGLFILMGAAFAANGALVYFAYKARPNLVATDYYERGENYQAQQGIEHRMKGSLGWRMEAPREIAASAGRPAPVTVTITDKAGLPAEPDGVTLYAYRPSDARYDFDLPMTKAGNGQFSAQAAFPLKGIWDLIIEAKKGDELIKVTRRISVLP
ncbi:MAG: FixH family protein [Nitrospinae bacterium]|nr:FixH family protein [Nitrospinota bacterium]